jgi:hypothetical protein
VNYNAEAHRPEVEAYGQVKSMSNEDFYRKLVRALLRSDFRFRASDVSEEDLTTDRNKLSSSVRAGVRVVGELFPHVMEAVTGVGFPAELIDFQLHPVFNQESVQRCLDRIREHALLVCCKYVLAQPIIVAVVEADRLGHSEVMELTNTFDQTVLQMRNFTGKIGSTKLTVTGVTLFTFFDHALAQQFSERRKEYKTLHLFSMVSVLPWTVDVPGRCVTPHTSVPLTIHPTFTAKKLAAELFGE